MIFLDSETIGLHGPIALLQYATDNGTIQLYSPWSNRIDSTIELFETIANHPGGIVAFNLAYDWFHICQMYTTLLLMKDKTKTLQFYMDEYIENEPLGRDGPCIKPVTALDLMVHARKTEYQSTMDRKPIKIRRVPTALAWELAKELEKRIPLKDFYFARRKKKNEPKWKVEDITVEGRPVPDFKDITLQFKPSSALKVLSADALNIPPDEVLMFSDVSSDLIYPEEYGFAPYAKAVPDNKGWPSVARQHINHWQYHAQARKYAAKDVELLQKLYEYFGRPPLGDDDSILTCCVAAVRWKGYEIDIESIKKLKQEARVKKFCEYNGQKIVVPTAPRAARYYIQEVLDETSKAIIGNSTKKILLEEISEYSIDCDCVSFDAKSSLRSNGFDFASEMENLFKRTGRANPTCTKCQGTGKLVHPAAIRAKQVLDSRQSDKEEELYDKLLAAGRFHASFSITGTLSNRMSGADKLNAQGIKKDKKVRKCFPLARSPLVLCGGDFSGFEVTLAEAVYNDPNLRKALQSGKKIHGLFGVKVFPEYTYDELVATDGTADDKYTRAKSAVFTLIYQGTVHSLVNRLGINLEDGIEAIKSFYEDYPGVKKAQDDVNAKFCSMRQPNGIGTKVEWHEPANYMESLFGFRRYFTLENQICKTLFKLANDTPKEWLDLKIRVMRRDREQSVSGAVQSALYGAAFQIQAKNTRAAGNHVIQSSGATITKSVQRKIWDLQPSGVHEWLVQPANIHDEIMCPTHPSVMDKVKEVVDKTVESFRPKVPLIKMDWHQGLKSWADK